MLRKRSVLFTFWIALAAAALLVANQEWYWVSYQFGETTKSVTATGAAAWPTIGAASWFWLIGLAALIFTKNRVRTVLAGLLTAITALELFGFLTVLGVSVSPTLNSQIEKASGLSGGISGNLSSAITTVNANMAMPKVFIGLGFLMLLVQAISVWASLSWTSSAKPDKYSKPTKRREGEGAQSQSAEPDDAISLWDSQR